MPGSATWASGSRFHPLVTRAATVRATAAGRQLTSALELNGPYSLAVTRALTPPSPLTCTRSQSRCPGVTRPAEVWVFTVSGAGVVRVAAETDDCTGVVSGAAPRATAALWIDPRS